MNQLKAVFIVWIFCQYAGQAQTSDAINGLRFITAIPLSGVSGRIDHLTFNTSSRTVYVAALGNNTVEVVDLENNKVIHSIKGLNEPQGLVYVPGFKSVIVANGGNGDCNVFSTDNYQMVNTIKLSGDADNVRYDSVDKQIYVGYASGAIAMIDAHTYKTLAHIKLDGHPESFQLGKRTKRIYVNVPEAEELEVIDLNTLAVAEKWKLKEAKSNFPMCLDESNNRLFIGCRHPAKLLILDTQSGKTIASVDTDADVDDVFYNPHARQIYLSCGAGYVDVILQVSPDKYLLKSKLETRSGARTSLYVPGLNRLIIAAPARNGDDAQLLLYQVNAVDSGKL